MGLLNSLIDNLAMPLIRASQEAVREKRRIELQKNSIVVGSRLISETIIESKELTIRKE